MRAVSRCLHRLSFRRCVTTSSTFRANARASRGLPWAKAPERLPDIGARLRRASGLPPARGSRRASGRRPQPDSGLPGCCGFSEIPLAAEREGIARFPCPYFFTKKASRRRLLSAGVAEREGFEPSVELSPHTRLAGERLQPTRPSLRVRRSSFRAWRRE